MRRAKAKLTTGPGRTSGPVADLYKQFEAAFAAMLAVPPAKHPSDTKACDQATDACSRIARRLCIAPATNIPEMLLKIKVAGWSVGKRGDLVDLDDWEPNGGAGEELNCLVSLREDLRLLADKIAAEPIASDKPSSRSRRR